MGKSQKDQNLTGNDDSFRVKKRIVKDICRIIEKGKGCKTGVHGLGLCKRHHQRFTRLKKLDIYGTPSRNYPKIKAKKSVAEGVCPIIENGEDCMDETTNAGLCSRHYQRCSREGTLKKYGKYK